MVINLSYNNLSSFPDSLLKFENLISLDIRKNKFENIDDLIEKISKFKYLSELKFDFTSPNQVQNLLLKSPQIILINGKSTIDYVNNLEITEEQINNVSLKKFLPIYNNIFTSMQTQFQKNNSNLSNEFHNQFQNLINEEATNINSNDNNLNYIYLINTLKSEMNILKFFLKIFITNIEYLKDKTEEIGKEILNNISQTIDNNLNVIIELFEKNNNFNLIIRKQLDIVLNYLKEDIEKEFSNKIEKIKKELNKNLKIYKDEKDYYSNKIERLEIENKYMTEHLIKTGFDLSKKFELLNKGNENKTYKKNSIENIGIKNISIKNMKEIINEIYSSKLEYDKKCIENKLPYITMEQHTFNFFNKKYGLKNLVNEWITSIETGIKIYSNEDNDINLFGKILRNEIDENEILILNKLKNSINEYLKLCLINKYPFKSKKELNKLYLNKLENYLNEDEWKIILYSIYSKDEGEIIEKRILQIIKELNNNRKKELLNELKNSNKKNIVTREEYDKINSNKLDLIIPYKEFLYIITDYRICYKEKYLKPFIILFKKYDSDINGILNEEEFVKLCDSISFIKKLGNSYIKQLLNKVDPFNYKRIIFSNCIKIFSNEIIEDINNNQQIKISLLDKLCIDQINNENKE